MPRKLPRFPREPLSSSAESAWTPAGGHHSGPQTEGCGQGPSRPRGPRCCLCGGVIGKDPASEKTPQLSVEAFQRGDWKAVMVLVAPPSFHLLPRGWGAWLRSVDSPAFQRAVAGVAPERSVWGPGAWSPWSQLQLSKL